MQFRRNMINYYFLARVFVNVIYLLYILSEAVGKPIIHDFCEHTYANQWDFIYKIDIAETMQSF